MTDLSACQKQQGYDQGVKTFIHCYCGWYFKLKAKPFCGSALFKDYSVLLGLYGTDVNLAVLDEWITVDVGLNLLKELLDVS